MPSSLKPASRASSRMRWASLPEVSTAKLAGLRAPRSTRSALTRRKGRSKTPPSSTSKNWAGGTPIAVARVTISPAALDTAMTQELTTSLRRVEVAAAPSSPVHTVRNPTASRTGVTSSRPEAGPAVMMTRVPDSAGWRVPETGES